MDSHSEENLLVQSCLRQLPFAWQQFVDRFLPVVLQSIQEIDVQTSQGWQEEQHHEFSRQVFRQLREDDFRVLRDWDPQTSFETFLIITTRRVAMKLPSGNGEAS